MGREFVRRRTRLERAQRAAGRIALVALAAVLASVPSWLLLEGAWLREVLDARGFRDVEVLVGILVVPVVVLGLVVAFLGWRDRRDAGWTRLELDDDGLCASKEGARRRLAWSGSVLVRTDSGVTIERPPERVVLVGAWRADGDAATEAEPLAFGDWRETELGRALLARSPERPRRRAMLVQLLLGVGLAIAWSVLLSATLRPLFHALDIADGLVPGTDGVERARAVVQLRPDSAMAWRSLARALLDGGRPAEAVEAADAAFALPTDSPAWALDVRSRALERLGRHREAARDRAGMIPWGSPWTDAAEASRLLLLAGDIPAARRQAERAVAWRSVPVTRDALARVEAAERLASPDPQGQDALGALPSLPVPQPSPGGGPQAFDARTR